MADAYVSTSTLSNQVITSYDRNAYFALREDAVFNQFADVKPGNVTSPGSPVTFTIWSDMALATTALTETVDPDAVALSDSQVSVTPNEYGNAVLITIKLSSIDFLLSFDPDVANLLSENMVKTIDDLAKTALDGGTNEDYVGQVSEAAITSTDIITAAEVRQKRAEMRGDSVRGKKGSLYVAVIHPDVSYDLQSETGDGAWGRPHEYVDTANTYNGEIGTFGGFQFVESADANVNVDGGATTTDTYTTYFLGAQALAKAEVIAPHMVMGPVVDKLMRHRPLGWHTYLGFDSFREAANRRLLSASSIGDN